jgi:hypothetical protein
VIRGNKITSRPPQDRNLELARSLKHVHSEPVRVRQSGAFVINATVNAAAKMFDEVSIDLTINACDYAV